MSKKSLVAVLVPFLAACGAGAPEKVEQTPGANDTCTSDKSYASYGPTAGCTCKATWSYAGVMICGSHCGNPDGDTTPWCFTEATCNGKTWAYCSR